MSMNREITLRALKGAPLSVLVALFWFGPSGRKRLVSATGYGRDVVGDALAALEGMSLIVRLHYRKWALIEEANLFVRDSFPQPVDNLSERRETRLSDVERRETRLSALVSSSSYYVTIDEGIFEACREVGIHGSKAEEFSKRPEIIERGPDYIRAMAWKVGREGKDIGLAVWRIGQLWDLSRADWVKYERYKEFQDVVIS